MNTSKIYIVITTVLVIVFASISLFLYTKDIDEIEKKQAEISSLNSKIDEFKEAISKLVDNKTIKELPTSNCDLTETFSKIKSSQANIVSEPIKSTDEYVWYKHYLVSENKDDLGKYIDSSCKVEIGEYYNQILTKYSPKIYSEYLNTNDRSEIKGIFTPVEGKSMPLFITVVKDNSNNDSLVSINFETKEIKQLFKATHLGINILNLHSTSKGLTIVFNTYVEPAVCGEGDCTSLIKKTQNTICTENKVGLWSYNLVTKVVIKISNENCKYIGS